METNDNVILADPLRKCKRKLDCSKCIQYVDSPLNYHAVPRGFHYPKTININNVVIFVLKGKLMVNSLEYNAITIKEGEFVLHAMGAEMETLALTEVECVTVCFSDPRYLCETSYIEIMDNMAQPVLHTPLVINDSIKLYLEGFRHYLDRGKICNKFYQAKSLELAYILSTFYSTPELIRFFYPIISYRNKFYDFIIKNYERFNTVEELASWGGYDLNIFLTLFRNIYKESAEDWIGRNKLDFHVKKQIEHE